MKGKNYEGEPNPDEVEAVVRGVARGSGDIAESEVLEMLEKKATEMGESFLRDLNGEERAIVEEQERLGRTYIGRLRRDGEDTMPREPLSLVGNLSYVDRGDDGLLVFRDGSAEEKSVFGAVEQPDRKIIHEQEER